MLLLYFVIIYIIATSGSGDYQPVSAPITFQPGSANGAEMCTSVAVISDNLVETEESFQVMLSLVTAGTSFTLGSNVSTVTLINTDGICVLHLLTILSFLSILIRT